MAQVTIKLPITFHVSDYAMTYIPNDDTCDHTDRDCREYTEEKEFVLTKSETDSVFEYFLMKDIVSGWIFGAGTEESIQRYGHVTDKQWSECDNIVIGGQEISSENKSDYKIVYNQNNTINGEITVTIV
jgi:hypothetical protein